MMHVCQHPAIIFVQSNTLLELDFQTHWFTEATALFLKKGQYIKKISDAKIQIAELENLRDPREYRYLFSHLTEVGHVEDDSLQSPKDLTALPHFQQSWLEMNPFKATPVELDVLFSTNELLEDHHGLPEFLRSDTSHYRKVNQVSKQKISLSLTQWSHHKLIKKAKYSLFHTGGSVQETAYQLGFKDPSYFGRFFKSRTNQTPGEFSESLERPFHPDLLLNLENLIEQHYRHEHQIQFYADRLYLTPKTLVRRVQQNFNLSVKGLIQQRLLTEARKMIRKNERISTIAFGLGFEEVSHFSAFFKNQTGLSPIDFHQKSTS